QAGQPAPQLRTQSEGRGSPGASGNPTAAPLPAGRVQDPDAPGAGKRRTPQGMVAAPAAGRTVPVGADFETRLAGHWFNHIGAVAIVIAAGLLLKFAYEHG